MGLRVVSLRGAFDAHPAATPDQAVESVRPAVRAGTGEKLLLKNALVDLEPVTARATLVLIDWHLAFPLSEQPALALVPACIAFRRSVRMCRRNFRASRPLCNHNHQ